MLIKTEAVVLRIVPFSETSHIVTWLSADRGRVVTLVKGAQRHKSMFLGQYDLFWTCELVYYVRERGGVHIARESSPIFMRASLRDQWRASLTASFVCDVATRLTTEDGETEDAYRFLSNSLDLIANRPTRPAFIFWAELKLLKTAGLAPELRHCVLCHASIAPTPGHRFSFREGGCICPRCLQGPNDAVAEPVRADLVALLQSWTADPSPQAAGNTRLTREQILACRDLFDKLWVYHSGSTLKSRQFVLDAFEAIDTTKGE